MKNQLQSVNLIVQFDKGFLFSKFEVSSLADKESCLSIAFDELKKTSNLSYILSSI